MIPLHHVPDAMVISVLIAPRQQNQRLERHTGPVGTPVIHICMGGTPMLDTCQNTRPHAENSRTYVKQMPAHVKHQQYMHSTNLKTQHHGDRTDLGNEHKEGQI